jgi:hypothetical protein
MRYSFNISIPRLAIAISLFSSPLHSQQSEGQHADAQKDGSSHQPTAEEIVARNEFANREANLTAGLQPRMSRRPHKPACSRH